MMTQKVPLGVAWIVCILLAMPACSVPVVAEPHHALQIGTYDSRAVAIAYAGSPPFKKTLQHLRGAQKAARDAGDRPTVDRLEQEGRALQGKLHRQGFGTEPVDDLLAEFEGPIVALKSRLNVRAIVSIWNEADLQRHAGAAKVDVTAALVDLLTDDERQRRAAMEITKVAPNSRK